MLKHINIALPQETWVRYKKAAIDQGVTLTDFIRAALSYYMVDLTIDRTVADHHQERVNSHTEALIGDDDHVEPTAFDTPLAAKTRKGGRLASKELPRKT